MALESPEANTVFLILTSEGGLCSGVGQPDTERVFGLLERVLGRKRAAGYDAHLYVIDNAERCTADFPVIAPHPNALEVSAGLDGAERVLRPSGKIDYVLIVGDDGAIPFHMLPNPAADPDGEFPSDAPYAVAAKGGGQGESRAEGEGRGEGESIDIFLLPDRTVGRVPLMPVGGGGLIPYLESLRSREDRGRDWERRFGLCALQWKRESSKVYRVLAAGDPAGGEVRAEKLRTSPPVDTSIFESAWLSSGAVIYFNVHGSKHEKYWYGQDGLSYPSVLSPEIVAAASPLDSIVLSEACYGGLVSGKSAGNSVALSFIEQGVAAFIGSSAIAYGSPDENLTEADLLAYLFFKRLVEGETCGHAFREARIDFAAEMLSRQGFLDGDDRKTLLEFGLFGDPTVAIYNSRRSADGSGEMVSEEVLASIKAVASQRFPEMEGVEPELSEQRGAVGDAVAKKVLALRPASAAKGISPPSGRILVATFRQTTEVRGGEIERIVRITFHESGQVIKVVTSK